MAGLLPSGRSLMPTWRYALLVAAMSIATVVHGHVDAGGDYDLSPLFAIAVVAGYLAKRRGLESTPVGTRAGVVTALVIALWVFVDPGWLTVVPSQSVWVSLLSVVALVSAVTATAMFTVFLGGLGAFVGGWLAEQQGHPRSRATN